MNRLTVYLKGRKVQSFEFDGTRPITLGRHADSDVVLDHKAVSRNHAVIYDRRKQRREGSPIVPTLEDLGSTNGMKVNDFQSWKTTLESGDVFEIQPFQILYESDEIAAADRHEPAYIHEVVPIGNGVDAGFVQLAGSDVSLDATLPVRVVDQPFMILKAPDHHGVLVASLGTRFTVSMVTYSFVDNAGPPRLNGVPLSELPTTLVDGDIIAIGSDEYRFKVSLSRTPAGPELRTEENRTPRRKKRPSSSGVITSF